MLTFVSRSGRRVLLFDWTEGAIDKDGRFCRIYHYEDLETGAICAMHSTLFHEQYTRLEEAALPVTENEPALVDMEGDGE